MRCASGSGMLVLAEKSHALREVIAVLKFCNFILPNVSSTSTSQHHRHVKYIIVIMMRTRIKRK